MRIAFEFARGAETRSAAIENPTVPVSAENFLSFFGIQSGNLTAVTIDSALTVPAVSAAVTFLSSSLANLPLHAYRAAKNSGERVGGSLQRILNEAPNDEWSSFGWRKYFWTQVFTGGRGVSWIERAGNTVLGIWPMDPASTVISMVNGRRIYTFSGAKQYPASDVIDVPFLLKRDQLSSYSPIVMGAKAIQLAIAMNDYGSNFFAGGGVPPLSLSGPLPQGKEAMGRAMADINRAIDAAKQSEKPIFPMPPGHELKQVGFDPAKGQMVEARLFQIQEIARVYNIPPVFLQDLSRGTFANVEQQDLHLIKHLIAQWAKAFEDELNLKLFGAANNRRYVEHSLDGLMRGDFLGRMQALAMGVQNGLLMPDEGRALDNRPADPTGNGARLYMQGAMAPLGTNTYGKDAANGGPNDGQD
ncbi:phage portal protein [Sphingobium sp. CFD-1]|uniref:phage portal protein n=1 Tax=Sphingobium sp. CFD-1 TaxID=2878545 RepID=UPI00214BCBE9|nr:phage portal protein [Sphingobium sp. CFD-1]